MQTQRKSPGESRLIDQVVSFAHIFNYDYEHARKVADFAMSLFEQCRDLHQAGNREKFFLKIAALLHDIAKSIDKCRHHKIALDKIIESISLPFDHHDRIIIGLLVRYHRGPLPRNNHRYFGDLSAEDKQTVREMASLLRLADGLVKSRQSGVDDVACEVTPDELILHLKTNSNFQHERFMNKRKTILFEKVFQRSVKIDQDFDAFSQYMNDPVDMSVIVHSVSEETDGQEAKIPVDPCDDFFVKPSSAAKYFPGKLRQLTALRRKKLVKDCDSSNFTWPRQEIVRLKKACNE